MNAEEVLELIAKLSTPGPNSVGLFSPGEQVFIRTVTSYFTGRVIREVAGFVELEDAAYIGDTGRFADAMRKHELSEVEPCNGRVRVNIDSIVDIHEWQGALPMEQK